MAPGLQVGLLHHIEVIDPHRTLAHAAGLVERQIFECLFRIADGSLVSEFFKRPLQADGDAFVGELREDLRWSDGSTMTGPEVCASLQRSGRFAEGSTLRADGSTIRFEVPTPLAALREALSVPGTALTKEADDGELLGSGPYKLDRNAKGLRLIRNEHHAGPRAPIAEIDFQVYENEAILGEALAKGLVDFTVALSPKELPSGSFVRTTYLPTPSTALLWMNCERLTDSRLRRAIAHGLDRRKLLALSYPGAAGLSADSSLPDTMAHCDDQLAELPSASRELLREPGVLPDRPLSLVLIWGTRPYLPDPVAAGEEIQRQLAELGICVTLTQTKDPVDYGRMMTDGEFDLGLGGWYADDPSAWSFLRSMYASDSVPVDEKAAGRCNFGRYRSPACDLALQRLRDDPHNEALMAAVGDIIRKDAPTVALHHGAATVALGRRIRGREFDSLGFPWFASFTLSKS